MKYVLKPTSTFKKEVKLAKKRNLDLSLLEEVVAMLADDKVLPEKYKDHNLHGNLEGFRECHIQPDWLLIYQKDEKPNDENLLYLYLARTGTHSDLFKK